MFDVRWADHAEVASVQGREPGLAHALHAGKRWTWSRPASTSDISALNPPTMIGRAEKGGAQRAH